MYLQKAPNGVYQTRVCIPKPLRAFGYPFDIKVSLLTKERSEAIERNFRIASCIKVAISRIDQVKPASFRVFKHTLGQHIAVLCVSLLLSLYASYKGMSRKSSKYSNQASKKMSLYLVCLS